MGEAGPADDETARAAPASASWTCPKCASTLAIPASARKLVRVDCVKCGAIVVVRTDDLEAQTPTPPAPADGPLQAPPPSPPEVALEPTKEQEAAARIAARVDDDIDRAALPRSKGIWYIVAAAVAALVVIYGLSRMQQKDEPVARDAGVAASPTEVSP